MALSLANMLTIVKRYVPTTTMNTELQDALLERMNYLTTLDVFPFQEGYEETTLTVNDYRVATPTNFATIKSLVIYTSDAERPLTRLDATEFDKLYPKPENETADEPTSYCIKVAEGEIWFNCPVDVAYVLHIYFYKIPDNAADTTISQLTEMAKLTLTKWASADGFRMMSEHDRADKMEEEGNNFLMALKRRYQLALREDARMISFKQYHNGYRGY